jgi:hypothetical protein
MSQAKLVTITCIAALAFTAFASATATAATAGWMASGNLLTGSAAILETTEPLSLYEFVSTSTTIICSSLMLKNSSLAAPNKLSVESMVFLLCAAAFPCGIANSRITTTPLTGEATLEGNLAAKILVKPSTGTLLSTVEFVGSGCTLQGVQPITGRLSLLAPTGQDEKVVQQISLSADA